MQSGYGHVDQAKLLSFESFAVLHQLLPHFREHAVAIQILDFFAREVFAGDKSSLKPPGNRHVERLEVMRDHVAWLIERWPNLTVAHIQRRIYFAMHRRADKAVHLYLRLLLSQRPETVI